MFSSMIFELSLCICITYPMIAHIQVFFWITESPVLWLDKIIEEKVALIDIENEAKIKVNQDLDESLQEFEGNQRWIYLNHCLHLLDSIKTHLIYAGYPLIKLGIIKSWMIFWIFLLTFDYNEYIHSWYQYNSIQINK